MIAVSADNQWIEVIKGVSCPGYAHKEHTADVLVVCKGRTLEELFQQAAIAVYEIITNTERVEPKVKVEIREEGIDLENLLYRFIESMLFYTDSEGLVFSRKIDVKRVEKLDDEHWIVEAEAWGEEFDPGKHEHRTIVKAMTYAQMKIDRAPDGCYAATFVPDI